jgi:uncharacterized protein (DUF885 family)
MPRSRACRCSTAHRTDSRRDARRGALTGRRHRARSKARRRPASGPAIWLTLRQAQALPNARDTTGWALYAESLGAQLGLYKDPASHFGQLASENVRAVRLVVDTGIHDLGWTRQQAIDYFKLHSPQSSLAEVDRYISWPAQALSYKMGELRIRSLRAKAEQQLRSKFDIRDFNDAVIRDGRLPLDLLTEQIDQFISQALR